MNRICVFIITLLLTITTVSAKMSREDSLMSILPTKSGVQKISVYDEIIAEREWDSNVDTTLAICDEWIAYTMKLGNIADEENARTRKLTVLYNNEKWEQLIEEAKIQRAWMEKNNLWNSFYKSWRDIVEGHSYLRHPQTALREAQMLKDHATAHDNLLGRALAYQQMGIIYDNIDHEESAKAFEQCVALMQTGTEDLTIANELIGAYFYLCQELDQMKNYERELEVCNLWKKHMDDTKERDGKSYAKNDVHYLEYHLWRASALIGKKDYEQAHQELEAAEDLNKNIEDQYLKYQTLVHSAQLALAEGNLQKAMEYSDQFEPMMNIDDWAVANLLRGEILMQSGHYRDAAQLFRKMYEQKDSIFSKDVRIQLDEFNTLFKLDEIKMKSQLERSRFIIGIIALVVVVLLLFIYFRHRAAQRLKTAHEQLLTAHNDLEKINKNLVVANARAEESSRMKSNFIRQISHEIRTPLNVLSGFTQILTTPGMQLDDDTKLDVNKRITDNTERITGLVNRMLDLSDSNSQTVIECHDDVTPIQIAELAAEDAQMNQARHIDFILTKGENADTMTLHTNERQAIKALFQLLDNARKFTKKGFVYLIVKASAEGATFTVEDTGIGVPAYEAQRIFDEFVQLDEYYDGTGIGLAVARSIARRLGGDIVIDTSYTGGARFIMTLPKE